MVDIEFCKVVPSGDPLARPVTIIGKKTNLSKVPFASVLPYLGNKVNEEVYFNISDQVARTAPRIFSTIEDTGNLNPVTIARENYRCRLCHLTQYI